MNTVPMTLEMTPEKLWETALGELELQMTRATFDAWLRGTTGRAYDPEAHQLTVEVKSIYAVEWLEHRLYSVIQRAVQRITANGTQVEFIVSAAPAEAAPRTPPPSAPPSVGAADAVGVLAEVLRQVVDPTTRALLQQRIAALTGVPEPEAAPGAEVPAFDTYGKGGGGWYPMSNYADTFWKPLLKPRKAFLVYMTIRGLDKNPGAWTRLRHIPIEDVTQRVPCSRNTVLGEVRKGQAHPGALDILRAEGIADVEVRGSGKHTTYYVSVLSKLPLLTPAQVRRLPDQLQAEHRRFLLEHDIEPTPWDQVVDR